MEQVAFFAGAIGALGGAIAVIALRNPFYSVLALVVHLFSLAGLFLLLHAEFLAAAQVVVYAGAVMVLYVFVAAYIGGVDEPLWDAIPGQRILTPLLAGALFVEFSIAILASGLETLGSEGPTIALGFGSPEEVGKRLLEDFLIPFEAASLLLLIAAVGAVVLAARRPPLDDPPSDSRSGTAAGAPPEGDPGVGPGGAPPEGGPGGGTGGAPPEPGRRPAPTGSPPGPPANGPTPGPPATEGNA